MSFGLALLGVLSGCEQHACPDSALAQGVWIPAGGTSEYWGLVAANETEVIAYDDSFESLRVFDPLTGVEAARSSPTPSELGPSGFAVTAELALLVSGRDGQDYQPVAQLWDRASDTWTELDLPVYAPPGQSYQVHWTGEVFVLLGAMDDRNQSLGGGAFFDPRDLSWEPLFDAEAGVPELYGRSIPTPHGLFWWAAHNLHGPAEAWLWTAEGAWRQVPLDGGPTSTYYHWLATDGDRVWLSAGYQGGNAVAELWELNLTSDEWKRIEVPATTQVGSAYWAGDRLFTYPRGCETLSTYQPDTREWGVAPPTFGSGWIGQIFTVAGHLVTYGKLGDGWDNGQILRLDL